MKIITSMIQIINKNPSIIDIQSDNENMETINNYLHKYMYNEIILKQINKSSLEEITSQTNQLLLCIFELIFTLSKIRGSAIYLIKNGIILELLLFALFYDKENLDVSNLVNSFSKKVI